MSPKITDAQAWDAKKKELLRAALRVFASRGFVGTRITDIAAEAGASPALLYHYFKDKDEVFTDLVRMAFSASLGSFELACGLSESPAVRLWFLLDFIFSRAYHGDGPLYFQMMIQAGTVAPIPFPVEEMLDQQIRRYADLLVPVLLAGQEAGEIRPGVTEDLFHMVIAFIQGCAVIAGFRGMKKQPPPAALLADSLLTPTGWQSVRAWQASGGLETVLAGLQDQKKG